ncbi:ABC transporter substrate-binding protein [Desertihabitans aurantiacus]|uniref:ABC transporter substrate-binding protein n=1 Tax=Desertihabitans aurantiacus TaxID=2282477 RepID=UPI000DF804F7|nr:extracellular solute-binding protein [Desertihabitans aurantiacus]
MHPLSRRRLLGLGAAAGAAAAAGGLSACTGRTALSTDPDELVLWLWNRSASPQLLAEAAENIPGTTKRLRADYIGTTFDTKLRTSLAAQSYIPDLTYINSNNALYFPSEDQFLDLAELGADAHEQDFYPWKWSLCRTPTGVLRFYPLDIGPTGFFYRRDIFADAGLPSEPEEVSAATRTWDEWLELGAKLRRDADVALVQTTTVLFDIFLDSSAERFFDAQDRPLFDRPGSAVRQAWDLAVRALEMGVVANAASTTDQNAGWVSGRTAGHLEGAWWTQVVKETAPDTAGEWRIATQPGPPGNSGGSFVAIPRTCKDPEAAFALIEWMQSPENQVRTYNDVQLFPSTPASFETGQMDPQSDFFGGQDPLEFFSTAAQTVPTTFISTHESKTGAFDTELALVANGAKEPEAGWEAAVAEVNRVLEKRGVI